jgi:aldose 1-epimerase
MQPLEIRDMATGSSAKIAAHLGFNCFEFRAHVERGTVVDVLDSAADFAAGKERPSGHGIPLLFPFPNRIRAGRFSWGGREYILSPSNVPFDAKGNAIHGLCLDRPWRVARRGPHFVVGQFQLSHDAPDRRDCWPADFLIEVRYEVGPAALRADIRIVNPGDQPLPWGFGTHPYFRLPLARTSDPRHCLIDAPAAEEWELVDCLPTGKRKPVSEEKDLRGGEYFDVLKLDDVLTGLSAGRGAIECVIMDEKAGLQVSQHFDAAFRELVVYTPGGRNAVCLEPYTCATDAINLQARDIDAGWRTLEPGGEFATWIEIHAGRVVA